MWKNYTLFRFFVRSRFDFVLSITFVSDSLINNRITRIVFSSYPTKILTMFLFFS